MRKTHIILLLLICFLFFSCGGTQAELYEMRLDALAYIIYENPAAEREKEVTLLGDRYAITYERSCSLGESLNRDCYYDAERLLEFEYSVQNGTLLLVGSTRADKAVIPNEGGAVGTDMYFAWLESKIAVVLGVDVRSYVMEWETDYTDKTEKTVRGYSASYRKHIGGHKSAERVVVRTLPDGSLRSLNHFEFPYHMAEGITMDEERLDRSIKECLREHLTASGSRLKSYTVQSVYWDLYDGKPCLFCRVAIEVAHGFRTHSDVYIMAALPG